ncbi:Dfp1/Him1, central region-domain-containing protein [Bisporella sp. PMI_857]|nr:Dfp1/Him1, central region-domain-containing protein [Bisporella sp. PMI_857]
MSNRRVALSNNPNAANSPYRQAVAAGVASKQKRSYATIQREENYGQPPPAKKQMLDAEQSLRTPPRQQSSQYSAEGRAVTRHVNPSQSSLNQTRVPVRERPLKRTVIQRATRESQETTESVLAWQKHYKKVFPTYVFYFETVSDDVRHKYAKQVVSLGARVEKFFSHEVTHVITTRSIPPEIKEPSPPSSTANESRSESGNSQTINPLLLERSSETVGASDSFGPKGKFTFEAPLSRRLAAPGHDQEVKRQQSRNADVLYKARSLQMKIWALEKLQRIIQGLSTPDSTQVLHGHNTRSNTVQDASITSRTARGADLSQLLRDERINGPSDRDPTVATKEINHFKGFFIYIHDIDERQKPIMAREYTKVADKERGDWPQFRSVANGKCPFVEDESSRKDAEREAARLQKQQNAAPRTRSAAAGEPRMQPPRPIAGKRTLSEITDGSNRNAATSSKQADPVDLTRESSSKGQQNAFISRAGGGARLYAGEPVASGVQPSNMTSAIRSQVISSTAAQPGAKAGTNKEIHGLQRKVLEKNSGGPGSFGQVNSHRVNESTATIAKRKQGKLNLIEEDADPSEAEESVRSAEVARKAKAVQQRKAEKRDPKPGYCENCQDKFEDFDEHILSRKHRKFAERTENWKELDDLLNKLARPIRVRD